MARVQFLAVRVEAEALLDKGHPCASIYERFKEAGKISMSYRAFHRYLKGVPHRKAKPNEAPETQEMPVASVPTPARPTPISEARKPSETASAPPAHGPRRIGAASTTDVWRNKDVPSAADLTIKPSEPSPAPESGEA